MQDLEKTFAPSDWVRITPLWPGIWRVHRVLSGFKESRWSLDEPSVQSTRTIAFCHRLVNDSWKRSFTFQCCDASYLRALNPEELQQVEALQASDKKLLGAFEKFQSESNTLDLIANVDLGSLTEKARAKLPERCNEMLATRIEEGVTLDEVLNLMRSRGLDSLMRKNPQQATIQLVSLNHELRGDEFLYRRYRVLNR